MLDHGPVFFYNGWHWLESVNLICYFWVPTRAPNPTHQYGCGSRVLCDLLVLRSSTAYAFFSPSWFWRWVCCYHKQACAKSNAHTRIPGTPSTGKGLNSGRWRNDVHSWYKVYWPSGLMPLILAGGCAWARGPGGN
eukprot:1093984-Rhodomonas_salina.1